MNQTWLNTTLRSQPTLFHFQENSQIICSLCLWLCDWKNWQQAVMNPCIEGILTWAPKAPSPALPRPLLGLLPHWAPKSLSPKERQDTSLPQEPHPFPAHLRLPSHSRYLPWVNSQILCWRLQSKAQGSAPRHPYLISPKPPRPT